MSGSASFAKGDEITIGHLGLGGISLQDAGTGQAKMGKCAYGLIHDQAVMVEDLLELGGGFPALMCGNVGFATHIHRIWRSNWKD